MTRARASAPALLWAVLAFALSACRTAPGPAPEPPDIGAWIEGMAARAEEVQNVQADGRLDYHEGKRHEWADLIWTAERPDRAVFELTSPAGLVAVAALDGRTARVYDARERRGFEGPADSRALLARLPWPLDPADLVPVLCAAPAPLPGARSAPEYDEQRRRWSVKLADPGGRRLQTLWFDPDGRLSRVRLFERDRGVLYEAVFLGWRVFGDGQPPYPEELRLSHPRSGTDLALKVRRAALSGTPLDPDLFRLDFPPGTPVERAEAQDAAPARAGLAERRGGVLFEEEGSGGPDRNGRTP